MVLLMLKSHAQTPPSHAHALLKFTHTSHILQWIFNLFVFTKINILWPNSVSGTTCTDGTNVDYVQTMSCHNEDDDMVHTLRLYCLWSCNTSSITSQLQTLYENGNHIKKRSTWQMYYTSSLLLKYKYPHTQLYQYCFQAVKKRLLDIKLYEFQWNVFRGRTIIITET